MKIPRLSKYLGSCPIKVTSLLLGLNFFLHLFLLLEDLESIRLGIILERMELKLELVSLDALNFLLLVEG